MNGSACTGNEFGKQAGTAAAGGEAGANGQRHGAGIEGYGGAENLLRQEQQRQRAGAISAAFAAAPNPTDHAAMRTYLNTLAGLELHVVFVHPNSKEPSDMRAPAKRRADDEAAREAAREAGRANWGKVKSPSGVYLASAEAAVLDKYLDKYIKIHGADVAVNLAVALFESRLAVVDCDQAAEVTAYLADAGLPAGTEPTVRSPGQRNAAGEWKHCDGGHFWFVVPEDIELPTNVEERKAPGGYAVMWGPSKYVLIPPSVREEGAYRYGTGGVSAMPR